ncbi:MAG: LapA family protein [Oscillatoria sp. Prado101]|nr:LapA family protein [Oscillatoria sp. Prado101]
MREFRILLLVAGSGGLAIFTAQNLSPVLPLVFLGAQSVALPLSVWILLAVAAGVLISEAITGLFRLSNYLFEQQDPARRRSAPPKTRREYVASQPHEPAPQQPASSWPSNLGAEGAGGAAGYAAASATAAPSQSGDEDEPVDQRPSSPHREDYSQPAGESFRDREDGQPEAVDDDSFYQEWEEEERRAQVRAERQPETEGATYEVKQEPTASSWSGTIYSYTYRQPSESGVGRTESVYDADYRVIKPPQQQPKAEEDDWETKGNKNDDWDWDDLDRGSSSDSGKRR